jgi:hypothetical protein
MPFFNGYIDEKNAMSLNPFLFTNRGVSPVFFLASLICTDSGGAEP